MAVAAFFAAYLALQIAVPIAKLWEPRPARFGWHMFSGVAPPPRFEVVLADGSTREAAPADHYGNPRADLRYEDHLPAHLCRTVPGARAVRVERAGRGAEVRACP